MLTIRVEIDDLRPRNYGKTVAAKRMPMDAGKRKEATGWDNAPPQTPDNTVDVRGYRTDEAIVAVEKFLDGCYGRDGRIAFIVHGHGTGALKTEIRRWIKTSKYVREQRRGNRHEGGDGVTAVLLS